MTTTSSEILCHTTAFTSRILSQSELRRHLIATLHRHTPILNQATLKHLNLVTETLENAINFSSTPTIRSSSLSLAEKLLLPLPEHPLCSFLFSLIHYLCNRHIESSITLLKIFHSNPSLARSEIAPALYDHLFSLHLLPVFRWFDEQRTRILSSGNSSRYGDTSDYSISEEVSVVFPCSKLLSRMSEDQTLKLRELEREYERVLDENSRVVAVYFEEVLVNKNGEASINPPLLILKTDTAEGGGGGDRRENREEEVEETKMAVSENGRYNNVREKCLSCKAI